jgi:hypothetical protein
VRIGAPGGFVSGRFVQPRAQTHADFATFRVLVDPQGNGRFSRERMRPDAYHEVPGALAVEVKPAPAARIRCTVRSGPREGDTPIGVLAVEDEYENPIVDQAFEVSLRAEGGGIEAPAHVLKQRGATGATFAVGKAGEGTTWLAASCWRSGICGVSNPVSRRYTREGHTIYFGDMHVMTGSAGNPLMGGSTDGALRYARDVYGLDFSAVTNTGAAS